MAPILATATGIPLSKLDEPLQSLLDQLNQCEESHVVGIVQSAGPVFFEEQVCEVHPTAVVGRRHGFSNHCMVFRWICINGLLL